MHVLRWQVEQIDQPGMIRAMAYGIRNTHTLLITFDCFCNTDLTDA